MKWTTAVLVTVLLILNVVRADQLEEAKKKIFAKCRNEIKVSDSASKGFYDFTSAKELKDQKCFTKCIFENYKIIKPDGTLDVDGTIKVLNSDWKTPENAKKYVPIVKDCAAKTKLGSDRCDYIYTLLDCYIEGKKNA